MRIGILMRRTRQWAQAGRFLLQNLWEYPPAAGYWLEHLPVLYLEAAWRVAARFDRRLYDEKLRIARIDEGRVSKPAQKFALFLLYAPTPIPSFTWTMIDALARSAFNIVIVSNRALEESERQRLLGVSRLVIERYNVGRDFGGYKDGVNIILRRFPEAERLIVANDSVFYLPDGLDRLIGDLDGGEDFIGVSEVLDHHYHVASFLMSFGRNVLRSRAFVDFWRHLLPIGTRRWNIFCGEGDLTMAIMDAGFRPRILFRAEQLMTRVEPADVALLPPEAREAFAGKKAWAGVPADTGDLPARIVGAVRARNQMHLGGFLFRKYLGLPIIKRDIVYRELYPYAEIEDRLRDLDEPLRGDILADLRRRGLLSEAGWMRRFLARHSAA
jgi:hypothetical protein